MEYYDMAPAVREAGRSRKGNLYRTTEPWECRWIWSDGGLRRLTVPKGYLFDGLSVPRVAWTAIGLHPGECFAASLPHDALYRAMGGEKSDAWKGCLLQNHNGNRITVGRVEADFILRLALEHEGVSEQRARWAWRFARLGGWYHWGGPIPSQR